MCREGLNPGFSRSLVQSGGLSIDFPCRRRTLFVFRGSTHPAYEPAISLGRRLRQCAAGLLARACSSARLERPPDKREVGSSSLPRPTNSAGL
jgi:hypothetical protein